MIVSLRLRGWKTDIKLSRYCVYMCTDTTRGTGCKTINKTAAQESEREKKEEILLDRSACVFFSQSLDSLRKKRVSFKHSEFCKFDLQIRDQWPKKISILIETCFSFFLGGEIWYSNNLESSESISAKIESLLDSEKPRRLIPSWSNSCWLFIFVVISMVFSFLWIQKKRGEISIHLMSIAAMMFVTFNCSSVNRYLDCKIYPTCVLCFVEKLKSLV